MCLAYKFFNGKGFLLTLCCGSYLNSAPLMLIGFYFK